MVLQTVGVPWAILAAAGRLRNPGAPEEFRLLPCLWLVGNGGMGTIIRYHYYHSSIPY